MGIFSRRVSKKSRSAVKINMKDPFEVTRITFKKTDLVDENGEFIKNADVFFYKKRANDFGLSLVCFNLPQDRSKLPLCKIIDFGKYKYEKSKEDKRKLKSLSKNVTKEVQFTPLIAENDIAHKVKHIVEFLEEGDDVIVIMKLKNRQKLYYNEAKEKLLDIVSKCNGKIISMKENPNNINIRMTRETKKQEK